MNPNKNANSQNTLILSMMFALLVIVSVFFFVDLKAKQKPLPVLLDGSSVTVYPGVVRTQDGTTYNEEIAVQIKNTLDSIANVRVVLSDKTVGMEGTVPEKGYQSDIAINGNTRFEEFLADDPADTEYALLADCMIVKSPDGGYAPGGVNCYVISKTNPQKHLQLINLYHPLFDECDLKELFDDGYFKPSKKQNEELQQAVDECTKALIQAIEREN